MVPEDRVIFPRLPHRGMDDGFDTAEVDKVAIAENRVVAAAHERSAKHGGRVSFDQKDDFLDQLSPTSEFLPTRNGPFSSRHDVLLRASSARFHAWRATLGEREVSSCV
ncbi:MAG: hypothetical protein AAGD12_01430 [Pseudomonadota bacterium]